MEKVYRKNRVSIRLYFVKAMYAYHGTVDAKVFRFANKLNIPFKGTI